MLSSNIGTPNKLNDKNHNNIWTKLTLSSIDVSKVIVTL